jgi:putative transposase
MESFYKVIGRTRQSVSKMLKRSHLVKSKEDCILDQVTECRKMHPRMGSRTMYYTIKNINGIELGIGVNKFERLLSDRGLTISKPKRKYVKTSDGLGKQNYTNLINGIELNNINQVICGDITYYELEGRCAYIFTLKDIYSQRILGLVPSLSLEAIYAVLCLEDAIKTRREVNLKGCIHHTDNGSQYEAKKYKQLLGNVGMIISRASNCLENGSSENLNGLVKNSYLEPWSINTFKQLQEACIELIYITNAKRAVKELDNLSPIKFEEIISQLPENERPIKKLYKFES